MNQKGRNVSAFAQARLLQQGVPAELSEVFSTLSIQISQWKAFWRKVVRTEPTPVFSEVVESAREFLRPAAGAARSGKEWPLNWTKGGL